MWIDYHTHHERCGHAKGKLEEYVQQGIAMGLKQLGLSDHMPLIHVDPASYYPGMAMPMDELPRYVEECFELKEKYKDQIDIRVGLEGDYIEGYEEKIEQIVTGYPWDYVIGSVHFLKEWDISDYRQLHGWEGRRVDDVFREYYEAVQKAAQTGFYHFIGHVDVIKRFGHKPEEDLAELERETLDVIKRCGIAIELNTSGLRHTVEEMFPSRRMLEYACEIGLPITIGSDAHQPERLGQFFEEGMLILKQAGFTELATFEKGQRMMIPL